MEDCHGARSPSARSSVLRVWRSRRTGLAAIVERAPRLAARVMFAMCWMWGAPVWGQPPARSFLELQGRVAVGDTVSITDKAGHETNGSLADMSATSLRVQVGRTTKSFSVEDVQRVQRRRADSFLNGALIGAAAGASYGLYWYLNDPNECGGTMCASDLARGMALGAAVGLVIDAAVREKVDLYLAPASRAGFRAGIAIRW